MLLLVYSFEAGSHCVTYPQMCNPPVSVHAEITGRCCHTGSQELLLLWNFICQSHLKAGFN